MSSLTSLRCRLANGVQLHLQQQPWIEQAGLCLRVAAGSHDEPEEYPGLAHFLEHLLFLGSRRYPAGQGLMAFVQHQGGQVNASTRARYTDFVCELPAAQLGPALQHLQDMLGQPLLELQAQQREREVLQAEYQARSQDSDVRIDHALAQALAPGQCCAEFLAGERSSLPLESEAFQQALRTYHQRHYQGRQMSLALVGPQSVQQLLELAQRHFGDFAAGDDVVPRARPASLLPLQTNRLRLQHPSPGVYLGLALSLPQSELQPALAILLDALQDSAGDGLVARLRQLQLGQRLRGRVLYAYAGECLLRLDCIGSRPQQAADLRAAFLGWMQLVRRPSWWRLRLREWESSVVRRQLAATPLEVARQLLEPQLQSQETLETLLALLEQMSTGEGLIELVCTPEEQPRWPARGLALPLSMLPGVAVAPLRLPASAVGYLPQPHRLPAVRLRQVPGTAWGGPAAMYWRAPLESADDLQKIEAGLRERIADLCQWGERQGIASRLEVQTAGWTLALHGAAELLPAFSEWILTVLLAGGQLPDESALSHGLLLRTLLQRLPQLCETPTAQGLQGLSVGLGAAQQAQLALSFERVLPLLDPPPPARRSGLLWQQIQQPGSDAAVVLFCPLAATRAAAEASWRLLGQWLQKRFYQRLRGELQLGYALTAGFRQVQGQRGLLFALQSPHTDAAGIFAHLQRFLEAQQASLAELSEASLEDYRAALRQALEPARSNPARAEQLWRLHLAGLPESHLQEVRQALDELTAHDVCAALGHLLAGEDWRVLASGSSC